MTILIKLKQYSNCINLRLAKFYSTTTGCPNLTDRELTHEMKHSLEKHWRSRMKFSGFDENSSKTKKYILSMFPYPSGHLHMGHVRVYTISDAMARYYRLNNFNVLHPMGWDAFGLPAENAAILNNIPANKWTEENIKHMKEQLQLLQCSFDWDHELATCSPDYYKWTQKLFLMLYNDGMAYQNEALVNWDPIDKTVLADEQVDANGCSWRSGAKVEKKILRQWFIRTTKYAKALLDGLDDPNLVDWRDIIKLQRHWIGNCNGFNFNLKIKDENPFLTLWTEYPEYIKFADFIAIKSNHILNRNRNNNSLLNMFVVNPLSKRELPIVVCDELEYSPDCDTYIGVPGLKEADELLAKRFNIPYNTNSKLTHEQILPERNSILDTARELKVGGYQVSSKLKDWLISRQRYWGTPIPVIHCYNCGAVPVPEENLPVFLPEDKSKLEEWQHVACPKCGNEDAKRELDTMDTFVDSSWYFLRYMDSKNSNKIFDEKKATSFMPVDLYIGGKEHAVLHLYYARFMTHFLHSQKLVPEPEPFKRLLVQGMVMGKSYRLKGSGKYLREHEIEVTDAKKNKAVEKETGNQVVVTWEKMSKSKLNGVDPIEVLSEYGCDTTRLFMLADVAPTSHRNWSSTTFPGILNWQKRLWLTITDFLELRGHASTVEDDVRKITESVEFQENDAKLFDARNYFSSGVTFNFKYSHQLSVAISKMQGLTNAIRRAPEDVIIYGKQYERALAAQIIMLAPMAPHFASELWSKFIAAPNRVSKDSSNDILWNADVLEQQWPEIDMLHNLDLQLLINGFEVQVLKLPRAVLDNLSQEDATKLALCEDAVKSYIANKKIQNMKFEHYPGCEARLSIFLERKEKKQNVVKQ